MSFTSEQREQLRSAIEQNQRRKLRKFGSESIKSPRVQVKAMSGEDPDEEDSDDEATHDLLADWRLAQIN